MSLKDSEILLLKKKSVSDITLIAQASISSAMQRAIFKAKYGLFGINRAISESDTIVTFWKQENTENKNNKKLLLGGM